MKKKITEEMVEEFLRLYIEGERIVDCAEILGIGKSTLYEMLKDPDIVKRLEKDRCYVQNQTRAMLMRDASKYVKALQTIAESSTDVRSKLKANETLLAYIIGTPQARIEATINDVSNADSSLLSQLYQPNAGDNEEAVDDTVDDTAGDNADNEEAVDETEE